MTATDWIQAISIIVLVIVTGIYAWRTHVISKATKEQADAAKKQAEASIKMAEEMTRPYLLLRLDLTDNELLQWDNDEGKKPPNEFEVILRNAGTGPAKNLEVSLWSPKDNFASTTRGYLAQNEEWKASVSKLSAGVFGDVWLPELKKYVKCDDGIVIVVKYQDIFNRNWASYLCLERHIDIGVFVKDGEQNILELNKK